MGIARRSAGVRPSLRALASQVHPVFMLPPLAVSVFGALVADGSLAVVGAVHVLAMFFAVYTAHVKDGFVDFHWRDEDDSHPLTVRGCRLALVGSTAGFACCLLYLGVRLGVDAALVTVPAWLLGYFHAPQLDTNPVTATAGYPLGIAVAVTGGYYVQAGAFSAQILAFAAVLLVVLSGVKIIDDSKDYAYDRSIDKQTVAVSLGRRAARQLAYYLMLLGLVGVLWLTVDGVFPPFSLAAVGAFGAVIVFAHRADAELATMLLIRGTYVFLAALVVAVEFRPLAGVGLPDIGVLGRFTYLATELLFGSAAVALLYRADALWTALRTLAVVYPVAYIWDWYTLEVGVFAIPLRTGWALFGIPVEEHLFILVVTGFIVGVHETLR